jgi:hypothetical protein
VCVCGRIAWGVPPEPVLMLALELVPAVPKHNSSNTPPTLPSADCEPRPEESGSGSGLLGMCVSVVQSFVAKDAVAHVHA